MGDFFDNLQALLGVGLTILTLASLAGVGSLIGNVRNLREQVSDADKEAERFRKSRDEERSERERKEAEWALERETQASQIAELQVELRMWQRSVTGEAHWVAQSEQLGQLIVEFRAIAARLERLDVLEDVARQITELSAHLTHHAEALDRLQASAAEHWRVEIEALVAIRQEQLARMQREARDDPT